MRNLTEEILALPTDTENAVSRTAALEVVKSAVPLEIDLEMYPEPKPGEAPRTEDDNRVLAIVSTAYNLMADFAAEKAAQSVRKQMEDAGVAAPHLTDQMMFEANKAAGEGATSYHDLSPHDMSSVMALGDIFDKLLRLATQQAQLGLRMSGAMGNPTDSLAALMEALGLPLPKDGDEL